MTEDEETYKGEYQALIKPEIIALVGAVIFGYIIVKPLDGYLTQIVGNLLGDLILGPLIEEPSKVIGIIFISLYYPYLITDKKRALLLGMFAGIGFALLESFLSLEQGYGLIPALYSEVLPACMHIIASATAAIGIGYISLKKIDRSSITSLREILNHINTKETRVFFIIAMFFHLLYNFAVLFGSLFTILSLISSYLAAFFGFLIPIVALVVDYYILNKIYLYLPMDLSESEILGSRQLLTKAMRNVDDKTRLSSKI